MRTPSSDMWRACVFILGDRLHPAPQTQSLEPRTFCWHSRYLTAHQARAVFACLCRRCPIHRTDLLFCFFFYLPLSKLNSCEEVGGGGGDVQPLTHVNPRATVIGFDTPAPRMSHRTSLSGVGRCICAACVRWWQERKATLRSLSAARLRFLCKACDPAWDVSVHLNARSCD